MKGGINRSQKSSICVDFHHQWQFSSNEDLFLHHKVCFEAKTQNSCLNFLYTHVSVCSATQNEFENYSKMKWSLTNRILSSLKYILCCVVLHKIYWSGVFPALKIWRFFIHKLCKFKIKPVKIPVFLTK